MHSSTATKGRLGLLVGGGPAPGINGVISAAGIEALDRGLEVVGFYDGFESLCQKALELKSTVGPEQLLGHPARFLNYPDLTHIHWEGGSILRTSRKRPTEAELDSAIKNLKELKVRYLIAIGGEDTLESSSRLMDRAGKEIGIAHVPKTIDNDLPLPANTPTFGFETARHRGTEIISSLLYDAKVTSRWFFVIVMGRSAGHLALGIAKSAGATRAIIPEEFKKDIRLTLDDVAYTIIASMLARRAEPRPRMDGIVVIAEGLALRLSDDELRRLEQEKLATIKYDSFGNIKLSNIQLGRALQERVEKILGKDFSFNGGPSLTNGIVVKEVGYELRCCHPIPFDIEYTRNLGYAATQFLLSGKSGCIISLRDGQTDPIPFNEIKDKKGEIRTRTVNIRSASYEVGRKYMFRIDPDVIENPETFSNLARVAGNMSASEFKARFARVLQIQA